MDAKKYLAAEESLKQAQKDARQQREIMTTLLSQVDDYTLRQDLMRTFHNYADAMAIRAECNEILKRDGHA